MHVDPAAEDAAFREWKRRSELAQSEGLSDHRYWFLRIFNHYRPRVDHWRASWGTRWVTVFLGRWTFYVGVRRDASDSPFRS